MTRSKRFKTKIYTDFLNYIRNQCKKKKPHLISIKIKREEKTFTLVWYQTHVYSGM